MASYQATALSKSLTLTRTCSSRGASIAGQYRGGVIEPAGSGWATAVCLQVLDGGGEVKRAELMEQRLREWKAAANASESPYRGLAAFRSPQRDAGLAKDVLQRRDRIGIDLRLAEARDPQRALLVQQSNHQRPVVLGSRILVGVVVDRDLEDGPVWPLRVRLPAPVLVEERRVEPALRQSLGDERGDVSAVEPVAGIRFGRQLR
jgi:hypothetical protein